MSQRQWACRGIVAPAKRVSFPPTGGNRHMRKIVTAVWLAALTGLAATTASAATPDGVCNRTRVVARALPAIVNITNVKVSRGEGAASDNAAPEQIAVFVGSGSVIDPSGVIITNKHVIQDAAMIWVTFHDRTQVPAQLIAAAGLVDLALLKVEMPHP